MLAIDIKRTRLLLTTMALLLSACVTTGSLSRQVYRRGSVAYQVGALPAEWQPLHFRGANLAFHHRNGGTIAASGYCPGGEDVPLEVLTNHLLFGIETRQELDSTRFTLDGRQALQTHLISELDGVPVELDLVVLKKDGCTYDLQLIAARPQFALGQRAFKGFVHGFATAPREQERRRGE